MLSVSGHVIALRVSLLGWELIAHVVLDNPSLSNDKPILMVKTGKVLGWMGDLLRAWVSVRCTLPSIVYQFIVRCPEELDIFQSTIWKPKGFLPGEIMCGPADLSDPSTHPKKEAVVLFSSIDHLVWGYLPKAVVCWSSTSLSDACVFGITYRLKPFQWCKSQTIIDAGGNIGIPYHLRSIQSFNHREVSRQILPACGLPACLHSPLKAGSNPVQ